MFGGMGSLNDVVLYKNRQPMANENREFGRLEVEALWSLPWRVAGRPILCFSVVCKGWEFRFNSNGANRSHSTRALDRNQNFPRQFPHHSCILFLVSIVPRFHRGFFISNSI